MPGRGPKIFQVEQKERLLSLALAFSKLLNLIVRGRLSPYLLSYISCNIFSENIVFNK